VKRAAVKPLKWRDGIVAGQHRVVSLLLADRHPALVGVLEYLTRDCADAVRMTRYRKRRRARPSRKAVWQTVIADISLLEKRGGSGRLRAITWLRWCSGWRYRSC